MTFTVIVVSAGMLVLGSLARASGPGRRAPSKMQSILTAQVAVVLVALVGAESAVAVLRVSAGAPTNATWLIALIAKLNDWSID